MFNSNPEGFNTQASQGNTPYTAQPLTGKEILARAFVNAMMSVTNPTDDSIDLPEEIWKNLGLLTGKRIGTLEPSEWLCFNLETGEIGRAYPYKGEYRIRSTEATDVDMNELQGQRVQERE